MYSKIEQIRSTISKVLMYGAILLVSIGIMMHIGQNKIIDLYHFSNQFAFEWHSFTDQLYQLDSNAISMLGLLLLMCIPITKILLYAIEFALIKNRLYLGISLLIIGILIVSIVIGTR